MNKSIAIQLMQQGVKLTHPSFTKDEWVSMLPGMNMMLTEDGCRTVSGEWWSYRLTPAFEEDWSLWEQVITIEVDGKVYEKVKKIISPALDRIDRLHVEYAGRHIIDRASFNDTDLDEYKLILAKV